MICTPDWSNFLALDENKADLARFLSKTLLVKKPQSIIKIVLAAGGFKEEDTLKCSC